MCMKNRCMYLGRQVHPFDKTGAPVLEDVSLVHVPFNIGLAHHVHLSSDTLK